MADPYRPHLFASFWQGGFECSSHRLRSGKRLDIIAATRHDDFALSDYQRLQRVGLRTVRDGFRWHLIERSPGEYDFSSVRGQLRAAQISSTEVIWDLMHYGSPDFVNLWADDFPQRFGTYARACAEVLAQEGAQAPFVCPINEMSFLAWGGGDVGYLNPFGVKRGSELKSQLVQAALNAAREVRAALPQARLVWAEPLIRVIHSPQRPQDAEAARRDHDAQFEVFDWLSGQGRPELGGSPDILDIVGLNYYPYNQWLHTAVDGGPNTLARQHALHRPLSELLIEVAQRYQRPLLISETGTENEARPDWLRYVAQEVLCALKQGAPLEGVCLYPVVNHPGWDDERHCHNGLWDYPDARGERDIYPPLAAELERQQRVFAALEPLLAR